MTDKHMAAAVEAAARSLHSIDGLDEWEREPEHYQEMRRQDARAMLAAFMHAVTAEPPEHILTASAQAIYERVDGATPWDDLSQYARDGWRDEALSAVTAAARATADALTRDDLKKRA